MQKLILKFPKQDSARFSDKIIIKQYIKLFLSWLTGYDRELSSMAHSTTPPLLFFSIHVHLTCLTFSSRKSPMIEASWVKVGLSSGSSLHVACITLYLSLWSDSMNDLNMDYTLSTLMTFFFSDNCAII